MEVVEVDISNVPSETAIVVSDRWVSSSTKEGGSHRFVEDLARVVQRRSTVEVLVVRVDAVLQAIFDAVGSSVRGRHMQQASQL